MKNKILYSSGTFFLIVFFLNYENYLGNKLVYLIFNLISYLLLALIIKKKLSAFEFFFYSFLLLSFWFKFSCILYFDHIKVMEGDFDYSRINYDQATIIIIFSLLTCVIVSLIKPYIFNKFFNEQKFTLNKTFINFYSNFRKQILLLFVFFLIFIWCINFNFKIYSKGIVNQEIPFLIKFFFSWSFTYGLSVLTSLLIYIDFLIFKNKKYFFLGIFETIFTNITILSRSFIISIIVYLRSFYYLNAIKKTFISKSFLLKTTVYILIFSLISFVVIHELRNLNFKKSDYHQSFNVKTVLSEFTYLSINRWVGIDGLLAVSQNKDLSFDFLKSSLSEKKLIRGKSFYINNFFKNFSYDEKQSKDLNIVITPGLIPYLYYSGSTLFVCFMLIIVIIFSISIEKLFLHFSGNNVILGHIIGYALALRFIHFGYIPYNTINFLLSFIITLLGIFILTKLLRNK